MSSMRWRVNRHEGHHPLLEADDPHRPESPCCTSGGEKRIRTKSSSGVYAPLSGIGCLLSRRTENQRVRKGAPWESLSPSSSHLTGDLWDSNGRQFPALLAVGFVLALPLYYSLRRLLSTAFAGVRTSDSVRVAGPVPKKRCDSRRRSARNRSRCDVRASRQHESSLPPRDYSGSGVPCVLPAYLDLFCGRG